MQYRTTHTKINEAFSRIKTMQKNLIILGGSKGLGQAIIQHFQAHDWRTMDCSRSGAGPDHLPCDLTSQTGIKTMTDWLNELNEDDHQHIELIINAAILAPFGDLAEQSTADIERHLQVNVLNTMHVLHRFVHATQNWNKQKGITYISSGAAQRAIPGLAIYSASKAFFERYIDTLAEEQTQQKRPIRARVINPGVMNTDMQTEIRGQSVDDFPMRDWWQSLYEKGQLADPADIARISYDLINDPNQTQVYHKAQDHL